MHCTLKLSTAVHYVRGFFLELPLEILWWYSKDKLVVGTALLGLALLASATKIFGILAKKVKSMKTIRQVLLAGLLKCYLLSFPILKSI